MIKSILIEDEDNSRDLLLNLINRYCPDLEIIGIATSVDDAVELINSKKPDLIFLDVEINGGNGFDILNKVDTKKIGIIFTTGYNQFAIKAIKFSAIDYLLKPIDFEELIDAVKKYKESLNVVTDERQLVIKSMNKSDKEILSLVIPSVKGFTIHNVKDILWLRSDGSYTTFKIKKEQIVASKPIGHFEDILPSEQFYRIHNRTIINMSMIKEYLKGKGGTVVLLDGEQLEVSERRKEGLLKILNKVILY